MRDLILHDISREMMSAPLYPGDPAPRMTPVSSISLGDVYNLSSMEFGLHTGTHMDAPLHFIEGGSDAAEVPLSSVCGECCVVAHDGPLVGAEAEQLLEKVSRPRILFKGSTVLTQSAAFVFSDAGIKLLGVEATSVSSPECCAAVHRQLLGNGVILLEGIQLDAVKEGKYFLVALPLKIQGADGSPTRAILIENGGY